MRQVLARRRVSRAVPTQKCGPGNRGGVAPSLACDSGSSQPAPPVVFSRPRRRLPTPDAGPAERATANDPRRTRFPDPPLDPLKRRLAARSVAATIAHSRDVRPEPASSAVRRVSAAGAAAPARAARQPAVTPALAEGRPERRLAAAAIRTRVVAPRDAAVGPSFAVRSAREVVSAAPVVRARRRRRRGRGRVEREVGEALRGGRVADDGVRLVVELEVGSRGRGEEGREGGSERVAAERRESVGKLGLRIGDRHPRTHRMMSRSARELGASQTLRMSSSLRTLRTTPLTLSPARSSSAPPIRSLTSA